MPNNNREYYIKLLVKKDKTEEEKREVEEYFKVNPYPNDFELNTVLTPPQEAMRDPNPAAYEKNRPEGFKNDLPNPFQNYSGNQNPQNESVNIKIPEELANIPKVNEAEVNNDYNANNVSASDGVLPATSDFIESGDEETRPPYENDEDTDLTDLPKVNVEEAIRKQVEDEINKTVEVKTEEPKSIKMVVENKSEERIATESEIADMENSNVDINLENINMSDINEDEIIKNTLDETRQELEKESIDVNDKKDEDVKYKVEVITSKSEGISEEQSKILAAIEKKKEEMRSKIIDPKTSGGHSKSYKNKYFDPLKEMQINIEDTKTSVDFAKPADETGIKALTKQWERTLPVGNKTKTALPLSGITVLMRSYTTSSILGLIENIRNLQRKKRSNNKYDVYSAFIEQKRVELESIWRHVEYVIKDDYDKPLTVSFEEFLKMVKLPDLEQLYFAAFDATYRDKNKYTLNCFNNIRTEDGNITTCNNEFDYYAQNDLICYIPNKYITPEEFTMLRDGFPQGMKASDLKIVKAANTEHAVLTKNKYALYMKIPSLYEYLETLDTMLVTFGNDSYGLNEIDLTKVDKKVSAYESLTITDYLLKICVYTQYMVKPSIVESKEKSNTVSITFENIKVKQDIINYILQFDLDTIKDICNDKGFRALVRFKGIQHYIVGAQCPKCGGKLDPIPIDMEDIFFSTTMEKGRL